MTSLENIRLRQAKWSDSDFAFAVNKAALKEYLTQVWGWDEAFQLQYHKDQFNPSGVQIIECEQQQIGWLRVVETAEQIEVCEIYQYPPFQSRGIGTGLMRDVEIVLHAVNIGIFFEPFSKPLHHLIL